MSMTSRHYAGGAFDVETFGGIYSIERETGNVVLWGARRGDVQACKRNLPEMDRILTRKQGGRDPRHSHFIFGEDGRVWQP